MRVMNISIVLLFLVLVISACNNPKQDSDPDVITPHVETTAPLTLKHTVISEYKHDTSAYTQGLEFYKGKLYESTGDYAASSLRITDAKTGAVLQKHIMGSDKIFGEGITIFQDKIYQLTWQNNEVYVYDVSNITKPIKTFSWPYEGWGITHTDSTLIISDGSANLYTVSPASFKVQNVVSVSDNNGPVDSINELEYVDGFVYANIYLSDRIIKINPASGKVVGEFRITNIMSPEETMNGLVLNGLAYNTDSKTFFITGKKWPKMFEIKLD